MRVLCFIYKGYSFQTVWAQWSTQSRTFPGALLPGIQFHDTSQHSSPLLSESYEIKYIMKILYFKWMRSFRHISLKGPYLKHCQDSSWECVKVGRRGLIFKIKPRREMMSCESFSWMSLVCKLRSQLCSDFKIFHFFNLFSRKDSKKRHRYVLNNNVSLHLHIKSELNPPRCISRTNNTNIIKMLSYFTILFHVHSPSRPHY